MKLKDFPVAYIEVYADGRTHLTFEGETPQKTENPKVIALKGVLETAVKDAIEEKLVPGRVYRIKITRIGMIKKSIDFDYERIR